MAISSSAIATKNEVKLDTSDVRAGGTPVGDLIRVPIERQEYAALYSWPDDLLKLQKEPKKKGRRSAYQPITPDILVEDKIGYKF
ncbi:MAG: hypothetical protein KJO62_07260 [Gammaproteobacteria bacterium]|nr:hypothetical protein [Gammaproteobacteria bacterium]NNM11400.1 hypothetical protein [Pseudomonadales bacterium]